MKPKIGLITLGVSDLKRSLEFYRDGLGLETYGSDPDSDVIFFALEGTWLALYPKESLAKEAGVSPNGEGFPGITLAHNAKSKAAVDEVFAEAIAAGAMAVKEPKDADWGGYSGYFADPDNFLWEVAYNPFIDLT
ncbi:VOC family protein [Altericroceibacterium endophyticum]|uniref:VOC family protein n=1 Tax=Altericroceibacterium endophyticum TaxID=1808508 RepID=A0A6I4T6G8_9SPHN|nr:VOC family protein [Altericroceibacterium endophyticum]MXO65395.1 VOC family protein [Altericroceibacterium endophyticum]